MRIGSALAEAAAGRPIRRASLGDLRVPAILILTIAFGIGVNAAIFSVVHAVLWRPLPYPDAARSSSSKRTHGRCRAPTPRPALSFDVRAQSRLITGVAQAEGRDASLEIDGVMERVAAARVTDDLLPLLGATPLTFGRALIASEDPNDFVVKGIVISHELWQRRFKGDPRVIGRRVTVNNFDVQVVGVMRPGFRLVLPATNHAEERIDVWLPKGSRPSTCYRGLRWPDVSHPVPLSPRRRPS